MRYTFTTNFTSRYTSVYNILYSTESLVMSFSDLLPDYCKHDMQFYDDSVGGTIDFRELERLCIERLTILGMIHKISLMNQRKTAAEYRLLLVKELRKREFERYADLCNGKGCQVDTTERREIRKMDNISHNTLRLVFISDSESLEWFRRMELFFFQWRLEALDERGILAFRAINNLNYPVLNDDEKNRLKMHIAPMMEKPSLFDATNFYKVPVLEILDLIKNRTLYLERGTAYINDLQFRSLIHHHFQLHLSSKLKEAIKFNIYARFDERMDFLGKHLHKIYETLRPMNWNLEKISANDLDELAESSYPPCMRRLHEALNTNHHLRNGGRVQYTLFLKAIGVPPEEAIEFYRKIFTKNCTDEFFQKEYAYRFRHLYGLVGSKKNYENQPCMKIAENSRVCLTDHHGCFFANGDIEDIGKKLDLWEIPSNQRLKIAEHTKSKEYGKACSVYFDALHGCSTSCSIIRPIDFFGESVKVREAQKEEQVFYDDSSETFTDPEDE